MPDVVSETLMLEMIASKVHRTEHFTSYNTAQEFIQRRARSGETAIVWSLAE